MDDSQTPAGFTLSRQIASDYKILRLLGKGGMGEVYLAEQLRVGRRRVALKVLNQACGQDPDVARRFENEAASAGRIQHRNVVTIYESRITDDGQLYVAMEYVDGKSLADEIDSRGPLPLDEVIEITRQICAGLSVAHKLGIVHRDVKPDNVMLTRGEQGELLVKLLDFGIARLAEAGSGAQTKTGIVMGTPFYMSPEQALGQTGDKIDSRSDIYSLGMVVYQMLTAKLPFESDSWMQIIFKHINELPAPPSQFRPELSRYTGVEKTVLRALEKSPDSRFQTATEFGAALESSYRAGVSGADNTLLYESGRPAPVHPFDSAPTLVSEAAPATSPIVRASPTEENAVARTAAVAATQPVTSAPAVATGWQTHPTEPTSGAVVPPVGKPFWGRNAVLAGALIGAVVICAGVLFLLLGPGAKSRRGPRRNTSVSHSFSFTLSTLTPNGDVAEAHRAEARYVTEDIGGVNLEMIEIPAGAFLMGSPKDQSDKYPDEVPRHRVSIGGFHMSRYEVTNAEWATVAKMPKVNRDLNPEPSSFKADPKLPVQNVSWLDAQEFCARLSQATGKQYRLPTEAEWEYACRGGTETPFYFGQTITPSVVNYDAHYPYGNVPKASPRDQPVPVGNMGSPNAFGLNDMHGNMAEWCLDGWHDNYVGAPNDGTEWTQGADTSARVIRGGSWDDGAEDCRSAVRHKYSPEIGVGSVGFRVVVKM